MRGQIPQRINSTYKLHIQAQKLGRGVSMLHPRNVHIHQTQSMVQVPFNVFMGWQTFQYYFTTKKVPDNIKFY